MRYIFHKKPPQMKLNPNVSGKQLATKQETNLKKNRLVTKQQLRQNKLTSVILCIQNV